MLKTSGWRVIGCDTHFDTRVDDDPKDRKSLLRCMLWILNSSGVRLNSKINLVDWDEFKDTSLYECKDLFHLISRG